MSKVQITLTMTNAVNPIRIHCSGVRCFQLIRVSPLVSHMRSQYIAVRMCPRFVTGSRKNVILDRQALTFVGRSSDFSQVFPFGPGAAKAWPGGILLRWGRAPGMLLRPSHIQTISFEIKFDGFHSLARSEQGKCRRISGKGNDFKSFRRLNEGLLAELEVRSVVLDGEICCLNDPDKPDFPDHHTLRAVSSCRQANDCHCLLGADVVLSWAVMRPE